MEHYHFGSKAHLSDEFLPHGFHELVSEAASASGTAVLRQIPPFGFNATRARAPRVA